MPNRRVVSLSVQATLSQIVDVEERCVLWEPVEFQDMLRTGSFFFASVFPYKRGKSNPAVRPDML